MRCRSVRLSITEQRPTYLLKYQIFFILAIGTATMRGISACCGVGNLEYIRLLCYPLGVPLSPLPPLWVEFQTWTCLALNSRIERHLSMLSKSADESRKMRPKSYLEGWLGPAVFCAASVLEAIATFEFCQCSRIR